MGTRGAVGVRLEGELYATYNHFDSYPDGGLGENLVAFVQGLDPEQLAVLKERFKHVVIVTEDMVPSEEDQEKYVEAGFYDATVGQQSPDDWYGLLRNLQGMEYIKAILEGKCQHWIDSKAFLEDSLFCEYAYIIDLDTDSIEFYRGFNKEPDKNSPLPFKQKADDSGYYPVKFKGKAALNAIPKDWIKQFYPPEEDD